MIVHGPGLREWIETKLVDKLPADAQFLGRLVNDQPVAVIGFSNWTGDDVEISVAADPGSGTVGLLQAIFGYAFGQLKCTRITLQIRDDNARSIKLATRVGFQLEGTKRQAKAGHDLLIYGLLRSEHDSKRPQTPSTY